MDYDPYIAEGSNALIPDLAVSLSGDRQDVNLEWGHRAPDCGYHVMRSTIPNSGFWDISGLETHARFADVGAALTPEAYFYYIEID